MKKLMACLVLLLTLFISFTFIMKVNAKDNLILNVSKNEINVGEELLVSINLDSEHTDLYAYTAKLSYDKDVFEVIEKEDFEEQENWSDIQYNKDNNKFALINKKGVNGEKLLQLKLQVKQDAKAGKTAIIVNSITASNGKKDIPIEGSSVEVLVLNDGLNEGESIPDNKVEVPEEDNNVIETKREIPVAGILLIILMIAIAISLIFYYLKLSKKDSKNKKIIITTIAIILLIILLVVTFKIFSTKSIDVNNDGEINYDDTKDLIEYILEIKGTQEDGKDKDLNNDGKVTITDVAQSVGNASNQEYTGNITPNPSDDEKGKEEQPSTEPDYNSTVGSSYVSNLTPKKGEEVTLNLNIDIKPYTDVEFVIINGKKYPVEKDENNGYRVTIPAPEKSGLQDVVITGVVLDNGKEVEAEYKVTFDVLKDIPKLSEFLIDTEKEIPEVSVKISDNDGAIKSGKVIVEDEEGNIVFESDKIVNGKNTYVLDGLEKDKKYNVKVEVQYDLDSDAYGEPEDNSGKETLVSQDFVINAEYGFIGTDYKITEKVTDKDALVVSFKNSYNSYYDVEYVIINGKKYSVSKIGDTYQVVLEKGSKGINTVVIEKVILQNGKSYNVNKELKYEYVVLKSIKPVVKGISVVEKEEDKAILAFTVLDEEDTFVSGRIVITNRDTKEEKTIIFTDINDTVHEITALDFTTYDVDIYITYNFDLNKENTEYQQEELLAKEEFTLLGDFEFNFNELSAKVDRDKNVVKLQFTVTLAEQAKDYFVKDVMINGNAYSVSREGTTYTVEVPLTTTDRQIITVEEIILNNTQGFAITNNNSVEIFKNAPTISGLTTKVEGNTIKANFQVIDEANIMTNAKVLLVNANGDIVQETIIDKNSNEVTFDNIEEAGTYTIRVVADYDRVDGLIHEKEVLAEDTIKKPIIATIKSDVTPTFAEKTSEIEVIYEIASNTVEKVTSIEVNGTKYPATETEDGKYKITYTTGTNAGDETLKVTSIDYNDENVKVEYSSSVEILKDELSIENFKVDTSSSQIKVTYEMIDDDLSFVSGKIIAKNIANGDVIETEISADNKEYALELEELQIYNVELEITCDRDSNNENDENQETKVYATQENVQFVTDYKLEVNDFRLDSIERDVYFNANIKFKATNASIYPVYGVVIDGKTYQVQPVENEEDTYLIEYPYGEENLDIRKEITVTDIVLTNNATIKLANEQSVVIFKDKPLAQVLKLECTDNINIKAQIELIDDDETVTAIYVILQNENGDVIAEQILNPDESETTFTVSQSGIYNVAIKADYDRVDGLTHSKEEIANSNLTAEVKPTALVTTQKITERYPKKQETIEITYKIESNTMLAPTKVVLNEKEEYTLTPVNEALNEYKISYTATDTSQIENLQVTTVYFGDNVSVNVTNTEADKIEVLKDIPTVTITSTDMLEQNAVMFVITVNDLDEAMTSGKAVVHEQEKILERGQNSFLVTGINPDEDHIISVEVQYDLDYNTIEEDKNEGVVNVKQEFRLISDYSFTINNIKTFNKDGEEKTNFSKNEPIELRFNCENKALLVPEKVTVQDLKDPNSKGLEYTVNTIEGKNGEYRYYVDMVANDKAGEQEFKIISVTLNGSKIISEDKFVGDNPTALIEVVKNVPTISDFTANNHEDNITVEFNIKDDDNALQESYVVLISDGSEVEKSKEKIKAGNNSYTFNNLTPGQKYTIKVENNYKLSNADIIHNEIFKEQEIEITKKEESNFRVKNLTITKRVPLNTKVGISFENSLMSYDDVDTIVIDNEEYDVTKGENGIYKLTLEPKEKGINILHVDGVKIKDKEFEIDRNLSYTYEYAVPVAKEVTEIQEDTVTNEAIINYKLEDEDGTVVGLTAYMKNSAGTIIETKKIDLDDEIIKTVKMDLRKVSTYSIELRATCDIGDGATFEEKTLFEKKKETKPRVTILSQSIDKEYVEKSENVVLTFKINTNVDQEVKKISIGDESYKVTKVTEGDKVVEDTYSITVQAPNETGIFSQDIESIQIGSNLVDEIIYPNGMEPINIKVYKQKPTITHFIIDENNNKLSFRVNDPDSSLVEPHPSFIVRESDVELHTEELRNGESEYEFNLDSLEMKKIQNEYNVAVDVTYDLRPDSLDKQKIIQQLMSVLGLDEETSEEGDNQPEEEEDPNAKYIVKENIFNENYKLVGKIEYNLQFSKASGGPFTLGDYKPFFFECSTGTDYKVTKVIIDGMEYPVSIVRGREDGKTFYYEGEYKAFSYDQESMVIEKVILENGAALDVPYEDGIIYCLVVQTMPTFVIKDFVENIEAETVTFSYKLTDRDRKLYTGLTFTLMNSQGGKIAEKVVVPKENDVFNETGILTGSVEFKVPYPPTAVYRLQVSGGLIEVPGYYDFLVTWTPINDEFQSSINTSILNSKLETRYPKKGETFAIDYVISSTKVILIDKDDHINQNKAVGITALVINGKDYDVQMLEDVKDTYRVYYTAQDEVGTEDINVTHIKFSNGDVEAFNHNDKIEILKTEPYVTNFKTENDLANNKLKLSFVLNDPDGAIGTSDIKAKIGDIEKQIKVGPNNVEFTVTPDELLDFEVKATYDLDDNKLPDETNANYNTFTDHTIFARKLMLTGDYSIAFSNIKTYNINSEETTFFEKNENIRLVFDCTTRTSELYPMTIKIAGNEYDLTKVPETENSYETIINGSDIAEKISAKIENITLNSGNIVPVENQTVEYEILKDHTKVSEFTYDISDSDADKVELSIKFEDADDANIRTRVEIIDEYGNKVDFTPEVLSTGVNSVSFKKTEAEKYTVSVYSTYDRDLEKSDEVNHFTDEKIHNQIVSLTTRYIEMKDIVDIKLYTFDDLGNAVRVDSLTEDNLNVIENSLVEVSMKNIPTFYSSVKSYRVEDNKLILVLSYTDAMVYTGENELKPLEVTLDILENTQEYEYKGSFKSLIEEMKANNTPDYVINLDKDYNLLEYPLDEKQTAYIDFDYKGKLNANGHTISNLTKPLFKKLDGATVENLVIKGITFNGGDAKGVVAIYATNNAKISNVHVENLVSPGNGTGALVYELSNNSVIEKCSATNITYNTTYVSQTISAGVVYLKNNSKIENCYVQGTMSSGWWNNAGFVVSADNTCEINYNIVNMKMSAYYGFNESYGYGNGGIVGADANNGKSDGLTLKNNLSLVEGNKGVGAVYNYKRSKLSSKSQNNYQLDTAVVKHDDVTTVSREELNAEFFRNKLGLDTSIWNISDDASIDNLPTLKGVSNSYIDDGKRPENTEIYIPDYKRVSELKSYREDREITYHNMYKLMPFYDAKEIIRDGNKIPDGHDLTKKIIRYVVPFNKEGKMISSLTTENYNSLSKIYIVFEDGTKLVYDIAFDDYYGNVASYMITELNVGYNYNKYIVDPQQDSVRRLIEVASTYDFKLDLDPVTKDIEEDSRLYKEHFDNYTKYHIEDFVINLLVDLGYSPNFESDVLDDMIERELVKSGKLKEYLFAYNYFTYWYNLDMDGINLADSVMFHSSEMFDKDMTMKYLTDQLIQGSNSATNGTAGFYNNYFVKYTRISNLGLYLDYYVTTLTHYKDGDSWFRDNWKGGVYHSVNVDGADDLYYTIWDHLKKDGKVQTDFLPLFTVPENSMFVMSSPSQAYFGSLRVYMTDPNDPEQRAAFDAKVDKWLKEIKSFYTFAYNYWGPDNINKYCDTNYDTRYTYTGKGEIKEYNKPLTTEEPFHKYFIEAINRWAGTSGGAYANGNEVFWVVINMLDNFRVGTHETLHNQDSKIFLNGYGRRGNAEDYAAGFIQQYYRDGWVSPNIFDEEAVKDNSTQNLHKSSVENDDKLKAFYNKYFRVNDFLDWIEAKAYFQLSAEQKANISVQVSYPKVGEDKQDEGDDVVAYTPLTKDMVEKMKLEDMQDLWDNKIMLRPGVKKYEERSPGADVDSIFNIHWYQPHADNDRPDGANFKYIAWQMAGEGGYYEGLVPYYTLSYIGIKEGTGIKTTDLIALRYIMKDPNITFKSYKLNRYEELSKHYDDEGTYINAEEIYQEYLRALKIDADNHDRNLSQSTAVKKKYFQQIRKETNDFNINPFGPKAEAAEISVDELEMELDYVAEDIQEQEKVILPAETNNTQKQEEVILPEETNNVQEKEEAVLPEETNNNQEKVPLPEEADNSQEQNENLNQEEPDIANPDELAQHKEEAILNEEKTLLPDVNE